MQATFRYLLGLLKKYSIVVGGEGFEPPKAFANGFTVRPGSPTPASARTRIVFSELDYKINTFLINFQIIFVFFVKFFAFI